MRTFLIILSCIFPPLGLFFIYNQIKAEGERDWLMRINHKECHLRALKIMKQNSVKN